MKLKHDKLLSNFACFGFNCKLRHYVSVLDYLSDFICCLYGKPGAYGVVTLPFGVREAGGLARFTLLLNLHTSEGD